MTDPITVFYEKDTVYEITINPLDRYQHYKSPCRLKLCVEEIRKKLLCTLAHHCEYTLVPEVSEPQHSNHTTGWPRVHFHGVITVKNPIMYLTETLHLMAEFSDIQVNPYRPDHWPMYVAKQKHLLKPILQKDYYLTNNDETFPSVGTQANCLAKYGVSIGNKRSK